MSTKKPSKKKRAGGVKNVKADKKVPADGLSTEPNDQDIQRRIGNFQGAGEPSRKGGRKGIVGQTSKKFKTDRNS